MNNDCTMKRKIMINSKKLLLNHNQESGPCFITHKSNETIFLYTSECYLLVQEKSFGIIGKQRLTNQIRQEIKSMAEIFYV